MENLQSTITLNNGVRMPLVGLGVYKAEDGEEVVDAVKTALESGYRSIDTAAFYFNEEGVGKAIAESGISRDEIFLTTKVWNDDHGYDKTLAAFEESRRKLGVETIDLYLIHWPVTGKFKETWRALEKLYHEGKVRAIGVSNFLVHHLEDLLEEAEVVPAVNQIEYHPWLTQPELHEYCKDKGIQLEAWSPLTRGRKFDDPRLMKLAEKYGKTPAQILLRWDLQNGVVTIPKSVTPSRIKQNTELFDFELTGEELAVLNNCNEGLRFGPHPDTFV
ncbi:aldo/keto reductase [Salipaludibacillus aurantiacus]|uniref:Aldo/keto reductase n=1 Tax=Salipaludibacillus aurantiacus TaxID=1601833 RepID=A0A1H9VA17_9BACI|nr:aldo/keto reductase [Salipaludibacillus aurantiacus]SES18542.1 Aldo/keto reductase [Salipaludibacillus aurantiacus]